MWLAIKVGAFYGAPLLAFVLAVVWCVRLTVRARRGAMSRRRAAMLYPAALLLAIAAVAVIWLAGQAAAYFAVPAGSFVWNGAAALQFFVSLLPLAVYVALPIGVLVIVFWVVLATMGISSKGAKG